MNKSVNVSVGIIGIIIAFILFPLVMESSHDIKTDHFTQQFGGVETLVGETTCEVTLSSDLYENNLQFVNEITSSNASDTPIAQGYSSATRALNISNLAENTSRTLTVVYEISALGDHPGINRLSGVLPLFLFIGILAGAAAAIWNAFR